MCYRMNAGVGYKATLSQPHTNTPLLPDPLLSGRAARTAPSPRIGEGATTFPGGTMRREISTNFGDLIYEKLAEKVAHLDDKPDANPDIRRLWVLSNATCWRGDHQIPLSQATRDHVIPRARGGSHNKANIRLACRPCNEDAGSDLPDKLPPDLPLGALPDYKSSHNREYYTVAMLIAVHGDKCWLCGDRVIHTEAVRCRIDFNRNFNIANTRVAHPECFERRLTARAEWRTQLAIARYVGPHGRLQVRRRVNSLKHRPVPVSWWRRLLRRIRAIVRRGTP